MNIYWFTLIASVLLFVNVNLFAQTTTRTTSTTYKNGVTTTVTTITVQSNTSTKHSISSFNNNINSNNQSVSIPEVAENGDLKNKDNDGDGRIESVYVKGYYKKNGTYVRGHYRAKRK